MKIEDGYWLINLRWIAILGVAFATILSVRVLNIPVSEFELYIISGLLLILNFIYLIFYHKGLRIHHDHFIVSKQSFVFIQIIIDLVLLTFLLHFSGGVENPFIIYYVFHLMIASILLSKIQSYLVSTITMFLVGIMAISEYSGFVNHYQLNGFLTNGYYSDLNYLAGTGFIFITTSYIVVFLTSTVSGQLKRKERACRQAYIDLRGKDKTKNEYVYRITHDIKGHVGAIKSCLDVVMLRKNEAQQQEFIKRAHNRTLKLISFIQDLLRITQRRLSDNLVMESISLREVIDEVIEPFKKQAKEKNISFIVEINPEIHYIQADRFSFTEALSNLISNSIKYSHINDKITVNVIRGIDGLKIEIADTGIGIPENEIPFIFNEFYRATNVRGDENESNGLGLSTVKQIIERHGGQISVKSKINEGACVTLIFPS